MLNGPTILKIGNNSLISTGSSFSGKNCPIKTNKKLAYRSSRRKTYTASETIRPFCRLFVPKRCNVKRDLPFFRGPVGRFSKRELNELLLTLWTEVEALDIRDFCHNPGKLLIIKRQIEAIIATVIRRKKLIIQKRREVRLVHMEFKKVLKLSTMGLRLHAEFVNKPSKYGKFGRNLKNLKKFKTKFAAFLRRNDIPLDIGKANSFDDITMNLEVMMRVINDKRREITEKLIQTKSKLIAAESFAYKGGTSKKVTLAHIVRAKTPRGKTWQYDGRRLARKRYRNYCRKSKDSKKLFVRRMVYNRKWRLIKEILSQIARRKTLNWLTNYPYYSFVGMRIKASYPHLAFNCIGKNCFTMATSLNRKK
ncbi:MAG: hypothetical protein ABIE74_11880 [Pseudomonadota bacterium]